MAEGLEESETRGGTLIKAVCNYDESEVLAIIKSCTDVNITDDKGKTALIYAVLDGMESVAALLIDAGADVNITDKEGRTALMYNSIKVSHFTFERSLTSSLMEAGADINITDNHGKTALMYAVQNDEVDKVVELINFGADVNKTDKEGKTALMYSSQSYEKIIVGKLLHAGADVNITDNEGKTALMYCACYTNTREKYRSDRLFYSCFSDIKEIASALLKAGADINITDNQGKTALIYSLQNGNGDMMLALIDAGADFSVIDNEGKTKLLFYAACNGNENVISQLIKTGTDLNKIDNLGKTALMYAAQYDKPKTIEQLIDAGADINITDYEGKTALIYAAQYDRPRTIEQLIDAGADVNITDYEGKTALIYAAQYDRPRTIEQLIDAGADVNITDYEGKSALIYAAQNDRPKTIEQLIDAGANFDITDNFGKSALMYAAQCNGRSATVKLIEAGADVNITDDKGKTALMYAVQNKMESVAASLIGSGTDVNITDDEGKTALMYAVQNKMESVAALLIDAGTDLNITYNEGKTALMYAVQNKMESVACLLIDAGTDVNITDNEGKTALMYAAQNKMKSVVASLIDACADVNITDNEGTTALFYGVIDENIVQALIEEGNAVIDQRDKYGRSPLFYAFTKSLGSACYLIEKGANLQLKDNCNLSILSFCVEHFFERGRLFSHMPEYFKAFQGYGVKQKTIFEALINLIFCKTLGVSHWVFLFKNRLFSVLQMSKDYVYMLEFKKKKTINKIVNMIKELDKSNFTQILELLEFLFELGADPNYADLHGNTALHYATCLPLFGVSQDVGIKICHQLEGLEGSFNAKNHQNETALLYCLSRKGWIERNKVKVLFKVCRFLLEHRSSVEDTAEGGKSVFHFVLELFQQGLYLKDDAKRKCVLSELLELLELFSSSKVTIGVTVNKRDVNLNSPLHLWASLEFKWTVENDNSGGTVDHDSFEKELLGTILRHLLVCGAKLNDRNSKDEIPLHLCRSWTAVNLLIDAGEQPNNTDSVGRTPLLVASNNITSKDIERFYPDVAQEQKSFWKAAIESHLDPWAVDKNGESVLSVLIKSEALVLVNALIELACEESYIQSDTIAVSLLSAICRDRSTRTHWKSIFVEKILKSRKVPIRYDKNKDTPLHFCCRNITRLPEELLFEKGISPNLSDGPFVGGKNISVHWTIAKHLLIYGADCNVLDESGQSCLDIARTCPVLTDLLTKQVNIDDMPVLIPWTSISMKYKHILAEVARRQECKEVGSFWYHRKNIQKGSFGLVFAGINEKDGREVAIKRIEKLRIVRPGADKKEISNLTVLADCEQVVRYVSFTEDEHFAYIILELMEGNLDDYLSGTFDVENSISLCEDVVKGLKYLHEQNILHRDLKPSNILFKAYPKLCFKIADFGLSRRIDSTSTTGSGSFAGTRCWIAPEVLKSPSQKHSMVSDVFSCGLVLHYVLSVKRHPFFPVDFLNKSELQISNETEANVMNNNPEGWDNSLCAEATDLLKCILNSDDSKRPKAAEAIAHPLFWSEKKKMDLLIAVGNQPEIECPRAKKKPPLTAVEIDLDNSFRSIIKHATWNDKAYTHMPDIYKEMTQEKRKSYDTRSVVELVRFIRNTHAHVSDDKRPGPMRRQVLEDFVFLECFPNLVMEVFNCVKNHGWDSREEIKYALK